MSRDGTRLIALVSRPRGDELVAARIVLDPGGRVARVVESTVIRSLDEGQRAIDVAWTGPAEIAVLTPARPGELYEVETVAADGATVGVDTLSTMVTGRVIGLAGEPYAETPVYAVARDALVDIRTERGVPDHRPSASSTTEGESPQACVDVAWPVLSDRGRIDEVTLVSALLDAGADLLLGSACVGCGEPGRVLCAELPAGPAGDGGRGVADAESGRPGAALRDRAVRRHAAGDGPRSQGAAAARPDQTAR